MTLRLNRLVPEEYGWCSVKSLEKLKQTQAELNEAVAAAEELGFTDPDIDRLHEYLSEWGLAP
ncbi:hypothetical protein [Halomonas sp.]|uniref:hypothetical protein n=1 Tax=Halomonas sp. TaxID=1486246 RepID=UPI00356AF63E